VSERYGQYELLRKLATGGMAQIYLARHHGIEGFERLCVVKRILPHLAENEDFVQMFLDEARIAARLSHTNIVQIYDLGEQDETYFIAMEYIHGEDLRRVWRRAESQGQPLPLPIILRIIADAASGLDYAHKRADQGRQLSIVHRDISPQNILVSFEGTVKVVDFGIAKAADKATHTRSGVLKGKYSYMSPEQAAGERSVDARTDVFALGVVLYELLTGTRLFKRGSDVQTLQAVTSCEVTPPSQVNPRVPQSLDEVVQKALTRLPEDRYPDALALQLALENWLIEHQQPASTAHVAAYLKELYADRLAAEAQQGMLIPEEVRTGEEELSPRGKRTPTGRSGRSPGGRDRSVSREAQREAEVSSPERTTSLRPERGSRSGLKAQRAGATPPRPGPAHGELPPITSPRVTEISRTVAPPRRTGAIVAAAVLLCAAAGLVVAVTRPGSSLPPAQVLVQTDPPGAQLIFDGQALPELSPTVLPPRPAGTYTLLVGKERYLDQRVSVVVPPTGEVHWPLLTLTRQSGGVAVAADGGAGPEPRVPQQVELEVQSEPDGARVSMNGRVMGTAPLALVVAPDSEVLLRAELAGHVTVERRVAVGRERQKEHLRLERRRTGSSGQAGQGTRPPDKDPQVTTAQPRGVGSVQFVIVPLGSWADVSCGPHDFGTTPFPPRQLPAGTYDCTFSHPELGTKRERVEVKANDLARVTVRFN
jgi:serine/threonine protein kinase